MQAESRNCKHKGVEDMNRGMLFTMDAVLALIAVIVLAAYLPQQFSTSESKETVIESLNQKAVDRAIIDFYSGTTSNESITANAEFGKCAVVYTLDPNNDLGTTAAPQPQTFCEEIE